MFCKEQGITQSMSKAGCPYDDAPMERFYYTFKNCFYYRFNFESVEMLDIMTKQYANWYNYVRSHSYNDYSTPMEAQFAKVFTKQSVKKLDQYSLIFSEKKKKSKSNTLFYNAFTFH